MLKPTAKKNCATCWYTCPILTGMDRRENVCPNWGPLNGKPAKPPSKPIAVPDVRLEVLADKIWATPLTEKGKARLGEGMGYYTPFWTLSVVKAELAYYGLVCQEVN